MGICKNLITDKIHNTQNSGLRHQTKEKSMIFLDVNVLEFLLNTTKCQNRTFMSAMCQKGKLNQLKNWILFRDQTPNHHWMNSMSNETICFCVSTVSNTHLLEHNSIKCRITLDWIQAGKYVIIVWFDLIVFGYHVNGTTNFTHDRHCIKPYGAFIL